MSSNQLLIIGGGSRGLGAALCEAYSRAGYVANLFHRADSINSPPNLKNYYFDLDSPVQLLTLENTLFDIASIGSNNTISFHVITGGSFGVPFGQASQESIEKVFLHNVTLPMLIAQHANVISMNSPSKTVDIFFYSSAVSQTYSASPFYVASKSALESFFKSYLRTIPSNLAAFLVRLGHVDIPHKYYHKFSQNDPLGFSKYLSNAVPTNHFTSPTEIANYCLHVSNLKGMFNGMVCDLTGGHSWI